MINNINISDVYYSKCFAMAKITDEMFKNIGRMKHTFVIDKPYLKYLFYPGFVFSNKNDAKKYYDIYYNKIMNVITPPRGNLTDKNTLIFIGQRPGHFFSKYVNQESAWLLGPSSKILMKLCVDLKIYPYFTNVYNEYTKELNCKIDNILSELIAIQEIKNEKLNIVFLGKYMEYDYVIDRLIGTKNFNFVKIYHPAYILRKNTHLQYLNWKDSLKNFLGDIIC